MIRKGQFPVQEIDILNSTWYDKYKSGSAISGKDAGYEIDRDKKNS